MKRNRRLVRAKEPLRDLKYRCLIDSITDDPRLLEGARFIDILCLQEQGASAEEARKIIGSNDQAGANTNYDKRTKRKNRERV